MDIIQSKLDNLCLNDNNISNSIANIDDLIKHVEDISLTCKRMGDDPILYLEVPNIYCRKYFDDEDFIYTKFDIPLEMYKNVELYNDGDFSTDAIYLYLRNVLDEYSEYSYITERMNIVSNMFYRVRKYYDYCATNNKSIYITPPTFFDNEFLSQIYDFTTHLITNIDFNPYNNINESCNEYEKELLHGANIIIQQIRLIIHSYLMINITTVDGLKDIHQTRLLRLINNISVILFYFKFRDDNLSGTDTLSGYNADTENEQFTSWKILTEL